MRRFSSHKNPHKLLIQKSGLVKHKSNKPFPHIYDSIFASVNHSSLHRNLERVYIVETKPIIKHFLRLVMQKFPRPGAGLPIFGSNEPKMGFHNFL